MKTSHASTHKKVVIRRLDKGIIKGYVDPNAFLRAGSVEVMDLEGRLAKVGLEEIKGIYFVRDFDGSPERSERKTFLSRPKLSGLWIRMTFKDSEVLDGLISQNLLEHDPEGYLVTPPDVYSNNLKVYVPRSALGAVEVLGVISNGARRNFSAVNRARRTSTHASRQIDLFSPSGQSEASS